MVVGAIPPKAREACLISKYKLSLGSNSTRIPEVTMDISSSRLLACLKGST